MMNIDRKSEIASSHDGLPASSYSPPPIPEPESSGYTTSTPVPLFWREDGPYASASGSASVSASVSARNLLLLHGGPGAHHDYLYPYFLELAKHHRLVTYDQRGGGLSRTDDREPITWRTQVDDMALVIRELALQPLTIIGYSWGGLLAMLYAIEAARNADLPQPDRLVLVSPAPVTREWRKEFESELLSRQRGADIQSLRARLSESGLRERDIDAYRQRSFELSVAAYFSNPELAGALTPFRVTGRVQQSIWESLGDFDLRESLRSVHMPVLVVHGRNDPIPLSSSEAVAESLDATLLVLETSGHVPYVEQPDELFEAIAAFLQQK